MAKEDAPKEKPAEAAKSDELDDFQEPSEKPTGASALADEGKAAMAAQKQVEENSEATEEKSLMEQSAEMEKIQK